MRHLTLLIIGLVSFSFSIPVYVIEKEVITRTNWFDKTEKKTVYITKGAEKEITESITKNKMMPMMKNMPGQQEGTNVRRVKFEKLTIFKGPNLVVHNINHENKSYTVLKLPASLGAFAIFMTFFDCEKGTTNCKPKKEGEKIRITNEFKKVGKWKARKIINKTKVMMMKNEVELIQWVAKDKLLMEAELVRFNNFIESVKKDANLKSSPSFIKMIKDAEKLFTKHLKKYGATVMSENVNPNGMIIVEKIKSVKKTDLPKSFFSVPKDYKPLKVPSQGMQGMPNYGGGYR